MHNVNDVIAMVIVSRLEQEQRIKEAANWHRAAEAGNAERTRRGNRFFGRKRSA
jgi:hypothetical protein